MLIKIYIIFEIKTITNFIMKKQEKFIKLLYLSYVKNIIINKYNNKFTSIKNINPCNLLIKNLYLTTKIILI